MKAILTTPPQLFQAIFHDGLLEVAREVGFVQRLRDFHPVEFARIFCLSLIGVARLTLQEIASELGITAAAVCKRLQQSAASEFFRRLLLHTLEELNQLVAARIAIPLLSRFGGIYLLDGTIVMLPPELADLFPGHGGGEGADDQRSKAAVKIMTRFRLDCPGCLELFLSAARRSDIESAAPLSDLPAGALLLADLGFFDGETLAKLTQSGIFWLTRLPPKINVRLGHGGESWCDLLDWLESLDRRGIHEFDGLAEVSQTTPFGARLFVQRCPEAVATERRRQLHKRRHRKGKAASHRQLRWCDGWVLATNVKPDRLNAPEAFQLYRSRWQIELMFKRWKSLGCLQIPRDHSRNRALCELYARLVGVAVMEWLALLRGGILSGQSAWLGWKAAKKLVPLILLAMEGKLSWEVVLSKLEQLLRTRPKQARRKKRRSTRQTLFR